jgi:WD40 repeat protein
MMAAPPPIEEPVEPVEALEPVEDVEPVESVEDVEAVNTLMPARPARHNTPPIEEPEETVDPVEEIEEVEELEEETRTKPVPAKRPAVVGKPAPRTPTEDEDEEVAAPKKKKKGYDPVPFIVILVVALYAAAVVAAWQGRFDGDLASTSPSGKRSETPDGTKDGVRDRRPADEVVRDRPPRDFPNGDNTPKDNGRPPLAAIDLPPRNPAEEAKRVQEREKVRKVRAAEEEKLITTLAASEVSRIRPGAYVRDYDELALATLEAKSLSGTTDFGLSIGALAFSPDGTLLAAGCTDQTVRLWDLRAPEKAIILSGGAEEVQALAFSPDGRTLASGGRIPLLKNNEEKKSMTVRLWDVPSGRPGRTLTLPRGNINALAFSQDGKELLVSASWYERGRSLLSVWDQTSGSEIRRFPSTDNAPTGMALRPDGQVVAIGTWERLQLSQVETGAPYKSGFPGEKNFESLSFSPDGWMLAAAVGDFFKRRIVQFDLQTGQGRQVGGTCAVVSSLSYSPDGKWLAGCIQPTAGKNTLAVWDAATQKPVCLLDHASSHRVAFSPAGGLLATGCDDARVRLWLMTDLLDDKSLEAFKEVHKVATIRREGQSFHADLKERATLAHLQIVKKLPRLTGLSLTNIRGLKDQDLTVLKDFPNLEVLSLGGARITDAGLAHLKSITGLKSLTLSNMSQVTNVGLGHLAGMTGLTTLALNGTGVTGAGLAHLKGLTNLEFLWLNYMQLADDDLKHLAGMTRMKGLGLAATRVTDGGLAHLNGMTAMRRLVLVDNQGITNEGLAHLKGMTAMRELLLSGTKVGDAGLAHIAQMKQLTELNLSDTSVTDAGFEHLAGLTNLTNLGLWRLPGLQGKGLAHLKGMTNLTELWLHETGVTDAGLEGIAGLTQLQKLHLPQRITDGGYAHLVGLNNLWELALGDPKGLTDAGLKHLGRLVKLRSLRLIGTGITDAGLANLKGMTGLVVLELPPQITDAGVAHLQGMPALSSISLNDTQITDAALKYLEKVPHLSYVSAKGTKVTDQGIKALQKVFPNAVVFKGS